MSSEVQAESAAPILNQSFHDKEITIPQPPPSPYSSSVSGWLGQHGFIHEGVNSELLFNSGLRGAPGDSEPRGRAYGKRGEESGGLFLATRTATHGLGTAVPEGRRGVQPNSGLGAPTSGGRV